MIKKEKVIALVEERMEELNNGLYIVELSISSTNTIHVEIDKINGGVTVTDCVSVSRNVEHNLDREEEDFELHVSSAGLDKPLRHINQYVKNIGRTVEVTLKDGKEKEGVLLEATAEKIVVKTTRTEKSPETKKKVTIEEEETLPLKTLVEQLRLLKTMALS